MQRPSITITRGSSTIAGNRAIKQFSGLRVPLRHTVRFMLILSEGLPAAGLPKTFSYSHNPKGLRFRRPEVVQLGQDDFRCKSIQEIAVCEAD